MREVLAVLVACVLLAYSADAQVAGSSCKGCQLKGDSESSDQSAEFDVYKYALPSDILVCSVEVRMILGQMTETCADIGVSCYSARCQKEYSFEMRTAAWGDDGCGGVNVGFFEVGQGGDPPAALFESQEASDYGDGTNQMGSWVAVSGSTHFVGVTCGGDVDQDFDITPELNPVTHDTAAGADTSMNIKFGCKECDPR